MAVKVGYKTLDATIKQAKAMKSTKKIGYVAMALVSLASGLWLSSCRSLADRYQTEKTGVEAWYPLEENQADSISGLSVNVQTEWVSKSPKGQAVADKINLLLLDHFCDLLFGIYEEEEDVPAVDSTAVPMFRCYLTDPLSTRFPAADAPFAQWQQFLVDRYLSEYRQDLGFLAAAIRRGEFLPTTATYDLQYKQSLVSRNKSALVWEITLYLYTGGAHGMYWTHYLNVDPQTGEELTIEKVFKPESKDTVVSRIRNKLAESPEVVEGIYDLSEVGLPAQFRLEADTITFHYQVYEIAPYVSGPIVVSLPKAALKDCLQEF